MCHPTVAPGGAARGGMKILHVARHSGPVAPQLVHSGPGVRLDALLPKKTCGKGFFEPFIRKPGTPGVQSRRSTKKMIEGIRRGRIPAVLSKAPCFSGTLRALPAGTHNTLIGARTLTTSVGHEPLSGGLSLDIVLSKKRFPQWLDRTPGVRYRSLRALVGNIQL